MEGEGAAKWSRVTRVKADLDLNTVIGNFLARQL